MSGAKLLGFVIVFDAVAVLILYPRLDLFSGAYLLISTGLAVLQAIVNRRFVSSQEIWRLFYARDIDKVWDRWVPLLGLAELAVFFEYARWRPFPELINHPPQITGLLLCFVGTLWLVWVDVYLVREFPAHYRNGTLMTSGPYRLVRHPRYLGLLATRLALPLVFCSIVGCAISLAWAFFIWRRARLEERYLSVKFGEAYANYAVHTLGIP